MCKSSALLACVLLVAFGNIPYLVAASGSGANPCESLGLWDKAPYRYMYEGLIDYYAAAELKETDEVERAKCLSLLVFYGSVWGLHEAADQIQFKSDTEYTRRLREYLRTGSALIDTGTVFYTPSLTPLDMVAERLESGCISVSISDSTLSRLPPEVGLFLYQEFTALGGETVWEPTASGTLVHPFTTQEERNEYVDNLEPPDFSRFLEDGGGPVKPPVR